jgi:DNA-binding GntR family transcriptional regulator
MIKEGQETNMASSALQRAFPAARPVGNQKVIAREVADQLREVIVSGRLRPGERLTELELANLFQVSRSPLREAFLQLENEGLVTLVPRKGAIVSEVSEADIRELYQVKGVLEGYVAGLVARRRDRATLGKLDGLMQQIVDGKLPDSLKEMGSSIGSCMAGRVLKAKGETVGQEPLALGAAAYRLHRFS